MTDLEGLFYSDKEKLEKQKVLKFMKLTSSFSDYDDKVVTAKLKEKEHRVL